MRAAVQETTLAVGDQTCHGPGDKPGREETKPEGGTGWSVRTATGWPNWRPHQIIRRITWRVLSFGCHAVMLKPPRQRGEPAHETVRMLVRTGRRVSHLLT